MKKYFIKMLLKKAIQNEIKGHNGKLILTRLSHEYIE